MANLHHKLLHIFPDYAEGDWTVGSTAGAAPVIEIWNRAEAQPSQATLDAVTQQEEDDAVAEAGTKRELDNVKALRAVVYAIADHIPGTSRQELAQEVRAIYKAIR